MNMQNAPRLRVFWLARSGEIDDPASAVADRMVGGVAFADALKALMDATLEDWSGVFSSGEADERLVSIYEARAAQVEALLAELFSEREPLLPQQRTAALQLVANFHFTLSYVLFSVLSPHYGDPEHSVIQETFVRGVGGKADIPIEFALPYRFDAAGGEGMKKGDPAPGAKVPTGKGYAHIQRGVRVERPGAVASRDIANILRTNKRSAERIIGDAQAKLRQQLTAMGLSPEDLRVD